VSWFLCFVERTRITSDVAMSCRSLRTQLCLLHPPVEIARACMFLAAIMRKIPLAEVRLPLERVDEYVGNVSVLRRRM
jgi:hypothetical protein